MNFEDYFLQPTGKTCQPIDVKKVEEKYNATYVGDFCLKTKDGNWSNSPVAIFWQEVPPVEGYSNYFGIFEQSGRLLITSGASAFTEPIVGVVARNGEVNFSRYRHDFHYSADNSIAVDGGRDYLRVLGDINQPRVHLVPDGPKLKIVPCVSTQKD